MFLASFHFKERTYLFFFNLDQTDLCFYVLFPLDTEVENSKSSQSAIFLISFEQRKTIIFFFLKKKKRIDKNELDS